MGPDEDTILRKSVTYRMFSLVCRWTKGSSVCRLLGDDRVLVGAVGLFLVVSLVRVLFSTLGAPVKFLSFLLLFIVLTVLTWNYTDPHAQT